MEHKLNKASVYAGFRYINEGKNRDAIKNNRDIDDRESAIKISLYFQRNYAIIKT